MQQLTLKQIAEAVGGKCEYFSAVDNICIDTRNMKENCLYIAIKGERFDGHDFIRDAFELGAIAVMSEKPVDSGPAIIVDDTRAALLKLAKYYRTLFNINIIGITGSVGKTTTKEMISTVLSRKYRTLKTQGNLNNEIGLPLTLLKIDKSHQAAVIEMGMSDFGEISRLSVTTKPNVAVITNIGYSHYETLGSRENILKAKLEIIDGLEGNAPLILNADDDILSNVQYEIERDIIYYGIDNSIANIKATNIESSDNSTKFDILYWGKTISAVIPTVGKHNILNALAAFCVGVMSDIPAEDIVKAFLLIEPADMRQRIVKKDGRTLIVDCYNASPTSMRAALSVLGQMNCSGKRIAILGDMLELGESSPSFHAEIADVAAAENIDTLICIGEYMDNAFYRAKELGFQDCHHFKDKDALVEYLKDGTSEGDVLLFKASRGVKLEEVIETIWGELT